MSKYTREEIDAFIEEYPEALARVASFCKGLAQGQGEGRIVKAMEEIGDRRFIEILVERLDLIGLEKKRKERHH